MTKIGDQGGNWLINGLTVLGMSVLQFVVLIPSVTVASGQVNSMKRTPRSTKRRAVRH